MNIRDLKRRVVRSARRTRALPEWRRLARHCDDGDDLGRLARAVIWARDPSPDATELTRIHAIEARRYELLSSDESVSFVDHGAISPDSDLSEEEMYEGTTRTIPLSKVAAASKPQADAWYLYSLVREFAPRTAIEMGTCVGISAAYQFAAMARSGQGRLVTMEGGESVAKIAEETLRGLGYDNFEIVVGRHQDTLPAVLAANAPIDFAFVDGDHAESTTATYQDQILERAADRAVIFHDDIRWSGGMVRTWQHICDSRSAVRAVVDLYTVGVCLVDKSHVGPPTIFRLHP
ncbi:MAG: class I SAM-dependent methyltransferase [Acidimicrobiia bacterium]|nr:class I SAM-dependent methyltransferase [Acidimicrobiia bacterium]